MSYLHLPRTRLPAALAELHRALAVGAPVDIQVLHGDFEGTGLPDDRVGGRFFAAWQVPHLADVVRRRRVRCRRDRDARSRRPASTACSEFERTTGPDPCRHGRTRHAAARVRAQPERLLGRRRLRLSRGPGNRFWPAASASGLVTKIRDPRHALEVDTVGMTDMVKRATPNASDVEHGRVQARRGPAGAPRRVARAGGRLFRRPGRLARARSTGKPLPAFRPVCSADAPRT